ncbi:hypothetical protein [Paenibacillus sp. 1781tsa1]|uniref:hypothetical protein n=1 Tax=Paenibacillus sp. 1781tsa1 TaxID=2953810 RepID=UPI00209EA6EA|nr:hypothetical protein [Paenibacillus sp. 1781tsa1]MCP1184951.1 hypothetical protein [Paenibacillus sp. 1781tsa1]
MVYVLTNEQKELINEIVSEVNNEWFIKCHSQNPALWDDEILHNIPLETICEYLGEKLSIEKKLRLAYNSFDKYVVDGYQGRESDFKVGMRTACDILGIAF